MLTMVDDHSDVGRRVPSWAAALFDDLSRDAPDVVTRADLERRLRATSTTRDVESTIRELRRLGWLVPLPVRGAWAFRPAGHDGSADPYLSIRGWLAAEPDIGARLAGANAAWHLGYLDRQPTEPVSVWLPEGVRLPDGLRPNVEAIRIRWTGRTIDAIAPTRKFLIRRKLDVVRWATGLPAFGPEALLVQLASRPASFGPWTDLVAHLDQLAGDCDVERAALLLEQQTASTWQRAAYLLHAGGNSVHAVELLERQPSASVKAILQAPGLTNDGAWSPRFHVLDRLVAPLRAELGKA